MWSFPIKDIEPALLSTVERLFRGEDIYNISTIGFQCFKMFVVEKQFLLCHSFVVYRTQCVQRFPVDDYTGVYNETGGFEGGS